MATPAPGFTLYDYWRSSAGYRVRIGLNLKGLRHERKPVHLVRDGGEQHLPGYREINPMQAVPVLAHGARVLRQSLAILEYLEDAAGSTAPRILPSTATGRAHVRALALLVACDIHPLNNLRVMQQLEQRFGASEAARADWMRHWMAEGFAGLEAILAEDGATGGFCYGTTPTLADICLVPQLYNAHRWGLDLAPYPRLLEVEARCLALPAFDAARPERQTDAPA